MNRNTALLLVGAAALWLSRARDNEPGESLGTIPLPPNPLGPRLPRPVSPAVRDPLEPPEAPEAPTPLEPTSRPAQATPTRDAAAWVRTVYLGARDALGDLLPDAQPVDPRLVQGALAIAAIAAEISAKGAQEIEHNPLRVPPDSATTPRGTLPAYPLGIQRFDATDAGALEGASRLLVGAYRIALEAMWRDEAADISEPIRAFAADLASLGIGPPALEGLPLSDPRLRQWGQQVVNQANALFDLLGPDLTR